MDLGNRSLNEECLPIKSLEELKQWKPLFQQHYTAKLRKRMSVSDSPKTLVCHDMKGGYLEDRFVNGVKFEDGYYFIHWSLVDVFVYFSHYLVTIPPCGWITAAHKNGVKILGTFITEWDEGARACGDFLNDKITVHDTCAQLCKIAIYFNFDGWLLNVENKIEVCQIPLLEEFITVLTTKMHQCKPGSLVIWYDSVIENGDLKWQNALNEHNRNFFGRCDGIFLNYNWKDEHLAISVAEASSRRTDVYVGVDVFGRGCLGGGGFSTDIAVTVARKFGLSVAIFSPGWVYECLEIKDFKENQYKFWNSLAELCIPRKIIDLPFYSSLCPGVGKKMFRNGEMVSSEPWYNIGLQQLQPTFHSTHCNPKDGVISIYEKDAYDGGGCLKITAVINKECKKPADFDIFSTYFLLETSTVVSYTFKPLSRNDNLILVMNVHFDEENYILALVDDSMVENICTDVSRKYKFPAFEEELLNTNYRIKRRLEENSWVTRVYLLKEDSFKNHVIDKVSFQILPENIHEETTDTVSVLLGEIEISPVFENFKFTYKDLLCTFENNEMNVQCLLEWTWQSSVYCSDLYILVNNVKHYIGSTSQFFYNFKQNLQISPEIEFILCPQTTGNNILDPVSLNISVKN